MGNGKTRRIILVCLKKMKKENGNWTGNRKQKEEKMVSLK